jgi:hypothetical protein
MVGMKLKWKWDEKIAFSYWLLAIRQQPIANSQQLMAINPTPRILNLEL